MKQSGYKVAAILLLLFCFQNSACFAQRGDEKAFRTMSGGERFRFVHDLPFTEMDSATLLKLFDSLFAIAAEKKDYPTLFALKYYHFQSRKKMKLTQEQIFDLLSEMEKIAEENGSEVEKAVAHHFSIFENYDQKKIPHERLYVGIMQEFGRMEEAGFEKFRDYNIARMLFHSGRFMYDLEDFEKALQFLQVAERYVEPTEEGYQTYVYVLNNIQSIYQKRKDYSGGIEYAKKLLNFTRTFKTDDPAKRKFCQTWEGIASIDIASMLVGQRDFVDGERFANEGYEIIRKTDPADLQTEYDALQVLIPTKLELGKMEEASKLLQRMNDIYKAVSDEPYFYFKHLRFFECYARFYEMKGNYAAAIRYTNLAKPLQDSLDRRNDARKLEQIQQRLAAEKYTEKLRLVESEKQLQTWLRNAAVVILLLVLMLAFGNYHRLQYKRRQKEAELQAAKNDLTFMTQGFREKSELAENLRLENEKLSRRGERSEYLEQLTHATILTDDDWAKFRTVFEKVHPDFIERQKAQFPDLTPAETRLLVLEKLDLSTQEMANMLGVNKNTINQTRLRLRRKTAIA